MSKTNPTTNAPQATAAAGDATSKFPNLGTLEKLNQLLTSLKTNLATMKNDFDNETLTPAERRRLQGSGVRRYGFIDKVSDTSAKFPEFLPPYVNQEIFKEKLREIEYLRNISLAIEQMLRISNDMLLEASDEAFQMALGYYNTVHEAARRRQAGAQEIFDMLRPFFAKARRTAAEPTDKEIERDVRALLHDRKDGEIVIKNERPRTMSGKRTVIDETHQEKAAWKETEEGVGANLRVRPD